MAELNTLARPYARAAFETACDSADLVGWSRRLGLLARVTQDSSVNELLTSPSQTGTQKASVLREICGDDLDRPTENFLLILSGNELPIKRELEVVKISNIIGLELSQ